MKALITLLFIALGFHLHAQCPELIETGNNMDGPVQVCKNEITYYTADEVENATFYIFSLSTGQSAQTDIPEIDVEWTESLEDTTYTLCISAYNDCFETVDYACLDIEFRHAVELTIEETLCFGEVLELGGNEYEAPGEYTYEAINQVGCDSLVFIILESHPALDVSAHITNDDGSCNGSIDLDVSGGVQPYTYAWSNGGNPIGLCEGTYTVTITYGNGCEEIFDFEVGLGTATSFAEKTNALPVYPNPAAANQTLSVKPGDHSIRSVEYFNMQGQVIWSSTDVMTALGQLQLPGIGVPGLYQVRMMTDDGSLLIGKVVISETDN